MSAKNNQGQNTKMKVRKASFPDQLRWPGNEITTQRLVFYSCCIHLASPVAIVIFSSSNKELSAR